MITFSAVATGCRNQVPDSVRTAEPVKGTLAQIQAAATANASIESIEKIAGIPKEQIILDSGEPAYITVQHCLIGFEGSIPGKPISRTKEEAASLAVDLLQQAKDGADFDEMVRQQTDDSSPGIYEMANDGFPGALEDDGRTISIFERRGMVPAFGNVGFSLAVGEFGLSDYDLRTSKYGWHIIRRIK